MTAVYQRFSFIKEVMVLREKDKPKHMIDPENDIPEQDEVTTVSVNKEIGMLYVMPDNAQHIGMRDQQQDYFAYSDLFDMNQIVKIGCVAVMADGMGGMQNGREAAIAGVDEFLRAYEDEMDKGNPVLESMAKALVRANDEVTVYEGAGATLIGAVVKENNLQWISVGDSHIYLFRNGLLRLLNEEHIYAKELDEMYKEGKIGKEEAENHPERKALTSYLGLPEITDADFNRHPVPLRMGDMILLCSDGLYGTLTEEEMASILSVKGDDLAEQLVRAALLKQRPQQDNVTAVLLKII